MLHPSRFRHQARDPERTRGSACDDRPYVRAPAGRAFVPADEVSKRPFALQQGRCDVRADECAPNRKAKNAQRGASQRGTHVDAWFWVKWRDLQANKIFNGCRSPVGLSRPVLPSPSPLDRLDRPARHHPRPVRSSLPSVAR